jgi:glutaconyl-CoA/methylmalonyl-CoA decarboxylase subunit delta
MELKKFFRLISYKKLKAQSAKGGKVSELLGMKGEVPSGDIVAIAMALHLFYDEVHDDESNVITIKRIERRYSPWSSKIYGVINNR